MKQVLQYQQISTKNDHLESTYGLMSTSRKNTITVPLFKPAPHAMERCCRHLHELESCAYAITILPQSREYGAAGTEASSRCEVNKSSQRGYPNHTGRIEVTWAERTVSKNESP